MTVYEAGKIVRGQVMQQAGEIPGFDGAFFHGSINELPGNASFPENSDVDIVIISEKLKPEFSGKLIRDGLILDVSRLGRDQLGSAEEILGQYHLAGSFRNPNIIADVSGNLTRVQKEVSPGFAKSYWVRQRCQDAAERVYRYLKRSDESVLLPDQVTSWLFAKGVLTHILLVAGLRNPTVRKRYLAVNKLLSEYHLSDFYEILLDSLGCTRIDRSQVKNQLQALTRIFDVTQSLKKTQQPFAGDISDAGRIISIEGSQHLIGSGYHREAVFWIIATYSRCMNILYHDAPDIYQHHLADYYQMLNLLGIFSSEDLRFANEESRKILPRVMEIAELIIRSNRDIRD